MTTLNNPRSSKLRGMTYAGTQQISGFLPLGAFEVVGPCTVNYTDLGIAKTAEACELIEVKTGEHWFTALNCAEQMTPASQIKQGTGSNPDGTKYRYAQTSEYRAVYFPDGGGTQGHIWAGRFGWIMDTDDEMPHEVWIELLRAVDAPLCNA